MTRDSGIETTNDVIIVGGGIGGVISLKYAIDNGLNALVLEKQDGVGGLWRTLPAWQDIQIPKEDWTFEGIPMEGHDQGSVLRNIEAWVSKFNLGSRIRTGSEVLSVHRSDDLWVIKTRQSLYRSRYLIAATGAHNRPFIPGIKRHQPAVTEFHSSQLTDPTLIRGKKVTVVGGGASAYDLLELCFVQGATEVNWVYRSLNWMNPTSRKKHETVDLREFGRKQMLGATPEKMSRFLNDYLPKKYAKYGLSEILPDYPLDLERHHFVGGRALMIKNFKAIRRHRGELTRIEGNRVEVSDGSHFEAELILYGTGYKVDLAYLQLPKLSHLVNGRDIASRCGTLFLSLDYPDLFLLGMTILDSNGSATFGFTHAAKSIMSHIRDRKVLENKPILKNVNYFDLVKLLARRDRSNYWPLLWYLRYGYWNFVLSKKRPLPLP